MHNNMIEKVVGLIFLSMFIWHEYSWIIKKCGWKLGTGTVIKLIEDTDTDGITFYPVIEWEYNGEVKTFRSGYDKGFSGLHDKVEILYSPDGEKAERYSFGNRCFVSMVGIFGALLSIPFWV